MLIYCKIAAASGAVLFIDDLTELFASNVTKEEVEESISSDASLVSQVFVESGLVLLRQDCPDRTSTQKAVNEAYERRRRATSNIEAARNFARMLGRDVIFVATAGTNSYLSAAVDDDIDFYCVTKTNGMWVFMIKALMLSRMVSLTKHAPPFCFSYVMDERRASEELGRPKDALFVRDTLTAKVIMSSEAYDSILEKARWMGDYFPALYARRLMKMSPHESHHSHVEKPNRVINTWLFLTLGHYLTLKAWLLNRRLTKDGRHDAVFRTKIGLGQLEYVSRKYMALGKMYEVLKRG